MGAEKPSPHGLWVEKSSGPKVQVNISDHTLVADNLIVELADMIFEAPGPMALLCMVVVSLFLTLMDEFHKILNKVSNLCHTESGDCRADYANDGQGKGLQVMICPWWSIQQELLGERCRVGTLRSSLCRVDNLLSGRVELRILGTVFHHGVSTTRD